LQVNNIDTSYHRNNPKSRKSKQIGLIAGEVKEVNPIFVSYNEDGEFETVHIAS